MSESKNIPSITKKQIFAETNNRCPFCDEADVAVLEIHHIAGRSIPNPHSPENLICVCGNCHSRINVGVISEADVRLKKRMIQFGHKPPPSMTAHGTYKDDRQCD